MAFHTFMCEKVEVAVIECGIGGTHDSTNVIRSSVMGITNLGIDHVGMLGDTIEEIARHKAGIMKEGGQCFTPISQPEAAKAVLQEVADQKKCELHILRTRESIRSGNWQLGLQGKFQQINASLAFELAWKWLCLRGYQEFTFQFEERVRLGLLYVQWPGRCETRLDHGIKWCIDGAHTPESLKVAGDWFASQLTESIFPCRNGTPTLDSIKVGNEWLQKGPTKSPRMPRLRFLIFNQQARDATGLAATLFETVSEALDDLHPFTDVIFCTNATFKDGGYKPDLVATNMNAADIKALTVQHNLADFWRQKDPAARIEVVRTIEEAVELVKALTDSLKQNTSAGVKVKVEEITTHHDGPPLWDAEKGVTALVTGSLHLLGGFLEVLDSANGPPATVPYPESRNTNLPLMSG